jgi:hypothetical protein
VLSGRDEPRELVAQTFAQTIARTLSWLMRTWQVRLSRVFTKFQRTKMTFAPLWGAISL